MLLTLGAFALWPALASAGGIGFRNDTGKTIYVQGSVVVNGQTRRGPLLLLRPGQTAWDVNLQKGPRTFTVYNPANTKLCQDVLHFSGKDAFFAVVNGSAAGGKPARVILKEIPLPPNH